MRGVDWLADFRFAFRTADNTAIIKNITGEKSIKELMDELRAEDPEAAMLLGEYIVVDEDE